MQFITTVSLICFSAISVLAQTEDAVHSSQLEENVKKVQGLSDQRKIEIFGDVALFQEDSLQVIWRRDELEKLKNIAYSKQIYSQDARNYALIYPKDTTEIKKRLTSEVKKWANLSNAQFAVIIKSVDRCRKYEYPSVLSYFDIEESCFMSALFSYLTAEKYGQYIKNKVLRQRLLLSAARNEILLFYRREQGIDNPEQITAELRKLIERSKPKK